MLRVGLTGNIASGKSTVARAWASLGAPVVDADDLARRAVAPGTQGLARVREAFGEEVITDGALDRQALRRIVFADPAARARLEGIVHPEVARLRAEEESRLTLAGAEVVVHDIPLIFEVGLEDAFDVIVVVDAAPEVRASRLAADRGLSPDEIRGVMAAQMDPRGKRRRADVLIENDGTIEDLQAEAGRIWRRLLRPVARAGPDARRRHDRLRVDMHVHTRLSFDSLSRPDDVVARAMARGLDRICITDHDEIEAALDLAARYPNRIIPGEEVKTREGVDIIGLYLDEWIPGGTPARETCERIREQGGLVYVPHPFAGGKGGGGRILAEIEDLVHIVEGFNARIHRDALNQRARDWAAERRLPVGAGSDAHTLGEIGNGYVDVPAFDNTAGSFLTAVRDARVNGTEASRLVHIASTLAKLVP
jgi:dephospho-CoA kinase